MYSKIKTWKIKNFRNLGSIELDFTVSPIIALIGENEAGKTSVVKTFGILGCNSEQSKQKDYIRDGTSGFGIKGELEDGISVLRLKTDTTNNYLISKGKEVILDINKIDRGTGIPPEVEKVMGLVIEPETKELLQVRTYEDQLLFVLTKSSENYKVMYGALKVENITKAINNGNKESNEYKKIVNNCEVSVETLRNTLRGIKVVDIGNAVKIKNRLKNEVSGVAKLQKVIDLLEVNNKINKELGVLVLLNKTSEINEMSSYRLNKLGELIENRDSVQRKINTYHDIGTMEELSISHVQKLDQLISISERIKHTEEQVGKLTDISRLQEIHCDDVNKLNRVIELSNEAAKVQVSFTRYSWIDADIPDGAMKTVNCLEQIIGLVGSNKHINELLKSEKDETNKWYSLIRESGAIVADCPNCGEAVVVDANLQ